jgi:radical SAM-linked protein
MDGPDEVRKKQAWLEEEAKRAHVDLRMHDCDTSWLEAVFARGDRPLANVLERAYRGGARFDSWEDQKKMRVWEEAFVAESIEPDAYLGTLPATARLPWDHIDVGLEEGFLLREYRKALKNRLSLPCGKVAGAFVHATNLDDAGKDTRKLVCYDCGVACDLSAMREQRLVYLRKLGAELPRPPSPPPLERAKPAGPPASFEQGEARRYRFVYEKLGRASFLSHLDLIRALPRAFRRLGLPLYYSRGFHPKPDMTYGPALSLGVASLCEVVDVKIAADLDPGELLADLARGSHDGMSFTGALRLGPTDPAITRVIDAARYAVAIPRSALAARGGLKWLDDRVRQCLEATAIVVVRRIDGVGKRVDVRSFVEDIAVGSDHAREAVARAGLVGDYDTLDVQVAVRGSGGVKIAEVIEALAGDDSLEHRAVRCGLGAKRAGRIAGALELELLRPSREARPEPASVGAE